MQRLSSTLHPQSYAPTCQHFTELKVGWFYTIPTRPPIHPANFTKKCTPARSSRVLKYTMVSK